MKSRHIRPLSVANAHVLAGGNYGEVELVVETANKIGFEWNDVVDIPREASDAATLHRKMVSLPLQKLEEFLIKRMPRRALNRPSFCGMHHGFKPYAVCPLGSTGVLSAPARNHNSCLKSVPSQNGESAALARTEPLDVPFSLALWGGPGDNDKATKFHAFKVLEPIGSPSRCRLTVKATARLGAAIQKGHSKGCFELAAITCAVPHAHAHLPISLGPVSCEHLKPTKPQSRLDLGRSLYAKASARLRVCLFKIARECADFVSALAGAHPANRGLMILLLVTPFDRKFPEDLPCQVNELCHDYAG